MDMKSGNEQFLEQKEVFHTFHMSRGKLVKLEKSGVIERYVNECISERRVFYSRQEIEKVLFSMTSFKRAKEKA